MKTKPILMSAPMVLACLNERKSQTRRILQSENPLLKKPFIRYLWTDFEGLDHPDPKSLWHNFEARDREGYAADNFRIKCPYGAVGDLLWVRETFAYCLGGSDEGGDWYSYSIPASEYQRDCPTLNSFHIGYKADAEDDGGVRYKPSRHMPRWASRLTLEITSVRVERLNSISEADALAEGVVHDKQSPYLRFHVPGVNHPNKDFPELSRTNAINMYAALWDTINGHGAWLENPFVWCIDFIVHHQNVDSLIAEREK